MVQPSSEEECQFLKLSGKLNDLDTSYAKVIKFARLQDFETPI